MIEHLYKNHNTIKNCKNLLNSYSLDDLSAMISSGLFDDIYVGDYIEMPMTSTYGTETVRWMIAGLNVFKHCGDTEITNNHMVMVPEDSFVNLAQMNSTNVTTGGYVGSAMYTTVLPNYLTAIQNAFGSSHILSHRELFSTAVTTTTPSMAGAGFAGASTSWGWQTVSLSLMNEVQLYGSMVCSSSFYDVGDGKVQFPLFRQAPELIQTGRGLNGATAVRRAYWLRAVASSTNFCYCSNNGGADYHNASSSLGVRPYFLFI